jgi:hypothetical protein
VVELLLLADLLVLVHLLNNAFMKLCTLCIT